MIRTIITQLNPILTKRAAPVINNEKLSALIQDLKDTLENSNTGVGLAAPQIGESVRMFMVNYEESKFKIFINPKIISRKGLMLTSFESCLSITGLSVPVSRYSKVDIEYYDESFTIKRDTFSGFTARIIQHEYDHLDGKLITDYI